MIYLSKILNCIGALVLQKCQMIGTVGGRRGLSLYGGRGGSHGVGHVDRHGGDQGGGHGVGNSICHGGGHGGYASAMGPRESASRPPAAAEDTQG